MERIEFHIYTGRCKRCGRRVQGRIHLRRERDAMFTFLYCPGLDATNYRAEQAIRPMVVTRKFWGGNRTEQGAHTQSVLVRVYRPAVNSAGQRPRSWNGCSICAHPTP